MKDSFFRNIVGYRGLAAKSTRATIVGVTFVAVAVLVFQWNADWHGSIAESFVQVHPDFGSLFGRSAAPGNRIDRSSAPESANRRHVAAGGLQKLLQSGGFTFDPIGQEESRTGFALSIYPEHGWVFDSIDDVTPSAIFQFLDQCKPIWSRNENVHIGGWYNRKSAATPEGDDRVYLDLIVVVDSEERAKDLGRMHGQLAAYNLQTGQLIPIMSADEQARWQRENHVESTQVSEAGIGDRKNRPIP